MYVDVRLTKNIYDKLRTHNELISDSNVYPSYAVIVKAKNSCYPNHIDVFEKEASVDFISLLGHATKRILLSLSETSLETLKNKISPLVGKWGMDGASRQQATRQRWNRQTNDDRSNHNDEFDKDHIVQVAVSRAQHRVLVHEHVFIYFLSF